MSIARHHTEWLSLVPVSGPFLSLPVLMEAFNAGLEPHDPEHNRLLRQAYADWLQWIEQRTADPVPHREWIKFVLNRTLDLDERVLLEGQAIPQTLNVEIPEHRELLRPSMVVCDPNTKKTRMLVQTYPRSQELTSYVANSPWKASPDTRMTELLHGSGVRLGLVTNGEHWMLVDAPKGETTGYASWYASLWLEEPITLRAFRSLLSASRFFNVPDDQTLESLLAKSASNQQEVTDQLGYQVRRAVEVLIHSLDRADQDFGRELLADVTPEQLYESALTVMMRLVFLFCAEERELIPSKPFPVYEQNYSVSTISKQLRELADQHGEELLERRYDAWPRLLAAFRAVYGGLQHDAVNLPAYGGSLFDPDRFPFFEGRKWNTTWRAEGSRWRVTGDGRREDQERIDGGEALSGTGSLAVGHGSGSGVLPGNEAVSTRRTIRNDSPDSTRGSLDSRQYRRGTRTGLNEGVSSLPEYRPGIVDGTGDASDIERADRAFEWTATRESSVVDRPDQSNAFGATESAGAASVVPSPATRNTQPATHHASPATHHPPRTPHSFAEANPLPVNNRTVLHLLEALQLLQIKMPGGGQAEARRLSFRALDIEQIGHVYEGLLDHTAKRATEPYLGLVGTRDKEPEIALAALERVAGDGWWVEGEEPNPSAAFLSFLKEQTGRSESALRKALASPATRHEPLATQRLRTVCQGDDSLWKRVQPLAGVVRPDSFGYPVVIPEGSVFVTSGTDRRSSGTHYTPRSLTEPIVQYTLEPLVYHGPAEGLPKSEWKLKPAKELLALKICDMACGSGAFLVQACRYLAERVLEAWEAARQANPDCPGITPEGLPSAGSANEELIPDDPAERKLYAMRLVAQRCLYGVDKNPLAVEMAKLSLWLLTMAKDKPFEFLDHNIRSGDSLVGLHNIDQLRHFSLKPDANDAVLFKGPLDEAVDEAINLRLKLEDLPANSVDDVQRQEKLLTEANEKIARLRCAADLLVAAEFWGENAKDKLERVRHAAVKAGQFIETAPISEFEQLAARERRGQTMFHWPLEFPEVVVNRGGFDAFVGNPPYMGGSKITGALGTCFRSYILEFIASGKRGTADLCAYFVLRSDSLLNTSGALGLVTTSTISQGDTREVCLDPLAEHGCAIFRAIPNAPWPGAASVFYSSLWMTRQPWSGQYVLDAESVSAITPYLTPKGVLSGPPLRLLCNAGVSFSGSKVYGQGFVLTEQEAQTLLAINPANKDVVFPYIVGEDLNSRPDQTPSRWVINFFNWPLSRVGCASDYSGPVVEDYPECLQIVERTVKIERSHLMGRNPIGTQRATKWWQYGSDARRLYETIAGCERVLMISLIGSHVAFAFAPPTWVYAHKVAVFAIPDYPRFGVLQSTLHYCWAWEYCSTNLSLLNYSTTDAFETFPFPREISGLSALHFAKMYYENRASMMLSRQEGLTKTYNRFHDSDKTDADIQKLRELHVEMDQAVAAAYGWTDLDLDHGFHETKQGVRFTISEPARREVLQRLLKLNHERYAEEVKQGLHGKKGAAKKTATKEKAASKPAREAATLFNMGEDDE